MMFSLTFGAVAKMATPEKPPGPVPAGGLNLVIAATFAQIVGPLRRHSQDAPGGVPVACRTPVKSPEMTPPAHPSTHDYRKRRVRYARRNFPAHSAVRGREKSHAMRMEMR